MPRRDSSPEVLLRRHLHGLGYRYRINTPVPGFPRRTIDIAFGRRRVAVFVDGCFWHLCPDHRSLPKRNGEWWLEKLEGNVQRDRETTEHLEAMGWTVIRIWEHTAAAEAVALIEASLRKAPEKSSL